VWADEGDGMSVDVEMLELAREVQACEVRLGLMPASLGDSRNEAFRQELLDRHAIAAKRLAELESEHGWRDDARDAKSERS
jgi:hypothetical protein